MKVGEEIASASGRSLIVAATRQVPGIQRVYNMTVEGEHVYYVSRLGALAHNQCPIDNNFISSSDLSKTRPGGPPARSGPQLPDDASVVRGGQNKPENFTNGSGVITDKDGNLQGMSVNSAPGLTVGGLSQGVKNNQVGSTTVGEVRNAGGYVWPDPTKGNPNHSVMGGIPAETASDLMQPTIKNPSKNNNT